MMASGSGEAGGKEERLTEGELLEQLSCGERKEEDFRTRGCDSQKRTMSVRSHDFA